MIYLYVYAVLTVVTIGWLAGSYGMVKHHMKMRTTDSFICMLFMLTSFVTLIILEINAINMMME